MTKLSWEDSRISYGVRDSKILQDSLSKIDQKFEAFAMEMHKELDGLQHEMRKTRRLVHGTERVFPRRSAGEQNYLRYSDFVYSFDETESGYHGSNGKEDPFHGFYHSYGGSDSLIARFKKNLLAFDGFWHIEDLLSWIDAIEDFFEEVSPQEHLKCKIVWYKMNGAAYYWWKQLQDDRNKHGKEEITSWPRMKDMLLNRFSSTMCLTKCPNQQKQAEDLKWAGGIVEGRERDDDQILDEEKDSNNGCSKENEAESIKVPPAASHFPVSAKSMKNITEYANSYPQESGNKTEQAYSKCIREEILSSHPCLIKHSFIRFIGHVAMYPDQHEVKEGELLIEPPMDTCLYLDHCKNSVCLTYGEYMATTYSVSDLASISFDPGGNLCLIRTKDMSMSIEIAAELILFKITHALKIRCSWNFGILRDEVFGGYLSILFPFVGDLRDSLKECDKYSLRILALCDKDRNGPVKDFDSGKYPKHKGSQKLNNEVVQAAIIITHLLHKFDIEALVEGLFYSQSLMTVP